ncbi:MAG: succinate dehydrogenase, hydrophobic membrane anchor protein [Sphingopyxis sp.]|nr:succinate dehydrogenase, hydrophobic membrane anchor protein [Sphingopyxis sp.]
MKGGTSLGRVRGLGSAKHGSHHWMTQRMTALGNVVLITWLFVSLLMGDLTSYSAVRGWVADPMVALLLMLLIVNVFWHLKLGLQVLIEDYVHGDAGRIVALVALNFYVFAGAAYGLFAVARVAFAGTTGA